VGHFDHDLVAVAHPHEEHLELWVSVSGFSIRFRTSFLGFCVGFRFRASVSNFGFRFRLRVSGCPAGSSVEFRKITEPVSVLRAMLAWVVFMPKIATGTLTCRKKTAQMALSSEEGST